MAVVSTQFRYPRGSDPLANIKFYTGPPPARNKPSQSHSSREDRSQENLALTPAMEPTDATGNRQDGAQYRTNAASSRVRWAEGDSQENPLIIEDDKANPDLNSEIDAAGDLTECAEAPDSEDELPPLGKSIIRRPTVVARSNGDELEIPAEGAEVTDSLQPEGRLQPYVEPSPEHDALEGRKTRDLADPTTVDHPDPIEEDVNDDLAGGDQSHAIREERLQSIAARDLNKADGDPFELQDFINASLGNHNSSPPAELQPLPAATYNRSLLKPDFDYLPLQNGADPISGAQDASDGNNDGNNCEDGGQAVSTILWNKSSPLSLGSYRDSELLLDNGEHSSHSSNVSGLSDGHAEDKDAGINEDRAGNRPNAHCPTLVAAAQPSCSNDLSPKHQDRAADPAGDVTTQSNDKDEQAKLLSSAPASLPTGGAASWSTRKRGYSKSALVEAEDSPTPPKRRRRGRPRIRGIVASHPSAPLPSSLPALATPAQIELDRVDEAAAEAQPTITDVNFHELSEDMENVAFLTACIRGVCPLPTLSHAQLSTLLRGILGDAQLPFELTTRQLTEDLAFLECFVVQCRGVEAPPENGTLIRSNGVRRKVGNVRAVELHDDEHYAGDDDENSGGDAEASQCAKRRSWSEEEEKRLLAWRQEGKQWDWIADRLRRSAGAVYVRWYTKLRSRA
ncbi:hypothetical protein H2201_001562 [Coniosporium apollinis]|uniref:Myb-like domain-containing protein n=1 Tax=Coniosporium apollinis TaxID=61459 RepID=A0ABQ9P270_9PEZI|nr:hypothetical protein H2201_001562 [Coniosporium apollinis]